VRRHATASFSRSKARKTGSSSRIGLAVLLATVAAFLLVPVAQAAAGTLKINVEGNGSGSLFTPEGASQGNPPVNCSYASPGPATGTCESEFFEPAGEERIFLRAEPKPGSEFYSFTITEGESLALCFSGEPFPPGFKEFTGGAGLCQIGPDEISEDAEITAVFKQESGELLTLNIEEGSGTVVSNPGGISCTAEPAPKSCGKAYSTGEKVTLTASPAPGYAFKSWKGCDSGGVNGRQCTVTMSSAKTVGAKFYKVWRLTAKKTGQGIFTTSPGGVNCGYGCQDSSADYKEGSLTLKAKPAKHFHFVEFTGGTNAAASCNGVSAETCTIPNFNEGSEIEEVYAEDAKNTLTVIKEDGGGQGFIKTKPTNVNCGYTCHSATGEFFASEEVEVTVTLNKGTTSLEWVGGAKGTCEGGVLTCKVPMSSAQTLMARFK